ncbi:hypothetical protein Q7P35_002881 [Cladosporium inversicolor]
MHCIADGFPGRPERQAMIRTSSYAQRVRKKAQTTARPRPAKPISPDVKLVPYTSPRRRLRTYHTRQPSAACKDASQSVLAALASSAVQNRAQKAVTTVQQSDQEKAPKLDDVRHR